MRRVITVSSGKGGVGKTTFAINFALTLARVAPTVLIDLDTGTSSVRNTIDVPVERDLYHFFRRGEPLAGCLTRLTPELDPEGRFADFAFVAAPRQAIAEIADLGEAARRRLVAAVNRLPATFVVLDLRAGLDAAVLDFLPLSNSGVLVFTPHHPAATLAAADIVRSLLFRKLRALLAPGSPVLAGADAGQVRIVRQLLEEVEDVYDERLPNLDAFFADAHRWLGDNRYLRAVADVVRSFGVYFVLNLFNGIEESYEAAVRPFTESLRRTVSRHVRPVNLGWVVDDERVHRANCRRRPILLPGPEAAAERPVDPVLRELAELESATLGLPRLAPPPPSRPDWFLGPAGEDPTARELDVLRHMYRATGNGRIRDNFAYIAHRSLHMMRYLPPDAFGHPRLYNPTEIVDQLLPARPGVGGSPLGS